MVLQRLSLYVDKLFIIPLLLLQSALQTLRVIAYSIIVGYSQQKGFYSGTSNPQLGGPVIRTFQVNPSSGRWNYGRENSENFAESGDFDITFWFFYMP